METAYQRLEHSVPALATSASSLFIRLPTFLFPLSNPSQPQTTRSGMIGSCSEMPGHSVPPCLCMIHLCQAALSISRCPTDTYLTYRIGCFSKQCFQIPPPGDYSKGIILNFSRCPYHHTLSNEALSPACTLLCPLLQQSHFCSGQETK